MTDAEFHRISTFLKQRYGIDMTEKKQIVDGRLANMLRKEAWNSYTEYMNALETDKTGQMEKELVNLLTTNHTYFMREFEHLDFLKCEILPYLKKKERLSKDIYVWCGASSTGEEPYMIAMTIMDFFGFEHAKWDTKVLATDISTEVLQIAVRGSYPAHAIEGLPEHWKRRFFHTDGKREVYEVTDELRKEEIFRQFNLMNPFPFKKKMHVVFLRNVMIYFDKQTKTQLIKKVYDCLEPGGYFIVGKTETIDREEVGFEMVKPSIFRKPEIRTNV